MTKTLTDDRLYALLSASDPLTGTPERAPMETEAALARLIARESTARAQSQTDLPSWRRATARWWAVRVTPFATAAAAAIALLALPASGPVTVSAASARVIRAKAAAALAGSMGAILHADISATQTWQNGGTDTWTEQDWQQVDSPYDGRSIVTGIWPTSVEMAYVRGQRWLYDASADTIYTGEPPQPFTLTPGTRPGTYVLRTGDGTSGPSLTVSAGQAAALRDGSDTWAGTANGGLEVVPRATTGPQTLSDFRPQALALLNSADAMVTRNVTVDGQDAIEVAADDGTATYYLDPATYAPIQMTRTISNTGIAGDPATVTLTFTDWRYLTGATADPQLLSLSAQHPDATIDNNPADYTAAETRLFR
jgi:hypothetical protein